MVPGDIGRATWLRRSFALEHTLHEDLDPIVGIYSQMGSIALNAVLDADIHVGETVAVLDKGCRARLLPSWPG